ncbi:hypothetical protein QMI71_004112 [Salmonella enterica]|nr:hypothetical protein [Salmonella enterica]
MTECNYWLLKSHIFRWLPVILKPFLIIFLISGMSGCIFALYPLNAVPPDPKIKDIIYEYAFINNEKMLLIGGRKDYILSSPSLVSLFKDHNVNFFNIASIIHFHIDRAIGEVKGIDDLRNTTACFIYYTHNQDEENAIKSYGFKYRKNGTHLPKKYFIGRIHNVSIDIWNENTNKVKTFPFKEPLDFGIFDNDTSLCWESEYEKTH